MIQNGHDLSKQAANRVRGAKKKRLGDEFEDAFQQACDDWKVVATRFPNGCERRGPTRIVQVPTPFDWVVSFGGKTALLDTKSSGGPFGHSLIKEHQVSEMMSHELCGVIAGYVIWFRDVNKVVFIPSSFLIDRMGSRGSISHDARGCIPIGTGGCFNPSKIFARFGIKAWMQKEIDDGPKNPAEPD